MRIAKRRDTSRAMGFVMFEEEVSDDLCDDFIKDLLLNICYKKSKLKTIYIQQYLLQVKMLGEPFYDAKYLLQFRTKT